jgi:hypothetical protein
LKKETFAGLALLVCLLLALIGVLWSSLNSNWLINAINVGTVPGRGPERAAVEYGLWFEIPRYLSGFGIFGMFLFLALWDLWASP